MQRNCSLVVLFIKYFYEHFCPHTELIINLINVDSGENNISFLLQIEQYKAEIKRVQESEAEIKALSINYAALLKETEVLRSLDVFLHLLIVMVCIGLVCLLE